MNKLIITFIMSAFFVAPVLAEKPEWAGKGKPTAEQKQIHKDAMNAKAEEKMKKVKENVDDAKEDMNDISDDMVKEVEGSEDSMEDVKDKMKKGKNKVKEGKDKIEEAKDDMDHDLENKKEVPSNEMENAIEQGSEKGKAAKAEAKEWWNFWE